MATTVSDQRIVTVEVNQAELDNLIVERAKAAGFIDFDPTRVTIAESDPAAGTHNVIFERSQ